MFAMKNFGSLIAMALSICAAPSPASAQQAGVITLGVTGGTEGVGPELSYRVKEGIGLRANATFLGFSHSVTADNLRYDGRADLASGGAMVDLYPFRGGFYLSAGARINGNRGRLRATPTQDTSIGGRPFTPAQIGTISGRGETKTFAPQATLGYGGNVGSHLTIGFEAGALFQGAIRIRDFGSNGTLATDPTYIARLERERAQVQDDVDGYKVYPIAQIRLGYRFR